MPMPPPSPSTDRRDRHTFHEMGQIVRALESRGPLTPEALGEALGAEFWEAGRFERAVALAVADGLVQRTDEGTLAAV
ncbi:hypothetical protein H5V45_18060 [Nocardioides sp. KIGAM211]|uniref:Uncharacterized protein n=1 Tax=Nocardioides luti TaxID=2761101 RepID=A0A7X0RJE0_9ACTN|nr:hypothetical protein [Nocardioides luti]MBB6629237.1 hypothetical protein [Nocardioides luti]